MFLHLRCVLQMCLSVSMCFWLMTSDDWQAEASSRLSFSLHWPSANTDRATEKKKKNTTGALLGVEAETCAVPQLSCRAVRLDSRRSW